MSNNEISLNRRSFLRNSLAGVLGGSASAEERDRHSGISVDAGSQVNVDQVTMFAFDDVSIPFKDNLSLSMHAAQKHADNPVLTLGKKGEPDEYRAQFYGTV